MNKRLFVFLLSLILIFSLAACQKGDRAETEPSAEETDPPPVTTVTTTTEATSPTSTEPPPKPEAKLLFPDRDPIAFMINNVAAARPQSGLAQAKLIYQLMTEGRTTRLLLLTDAQEGVIGPVRSARPAYLDLVAQHRAFYCYAGNYVVIEESPLVNDMRILDALKGDYGIFYRTDHRVAPHNLYTNMEDAYARAEKKYGSLKSADPAPGPRVRDQALWPPGGDAAAEIHYRFSALKESFRYDEDQQVYHKYNGDEVLVDEQTGEILEVANIIVLHRPHSFMPNGVHNKVNWIDQAEADYLTGGRKYRIRWEKTSHVGPLVYFLGDEELILNPGLTWIIVVDDSALATVEYR